MYNNQIFLLCEQLINAVTPLMEREHISYMTNEAKEVCEDFNDKFNMEFDENDFADEFADALSHECVSTRDVLTTGYDEIYSQLAVWFSNWKYGEVRNVEVIIDVIKTVLE